MTGYVAADRRTLGFRAAGTGRRGGDHRRSGPLPGRLPDAARRPARRRDRAAPAAAGPNGRRDRGRLAWIITDGPPFHNGGTGGFTASMMIDQGAGHAVAGLVNTHGSSAPLLDAVVMAAVKGSDPRLARPRDNGESAGPEWDARASALSRALIDGDYARVHRMLRPEDQPKLTAERLGQMWQSALGHIGVPGPVSVSCRSQPDGVAALNHVHRQQRPAVAPGRVHRLRPGRHAARHRPGRSAALVTVARFAAAREARRAISGVATTVGSVHASTLPKPRLTTNSAVVSET